MVTAKYTASTGSLRVTVKTAAAMNLRKKNQLVFMFTGTSCKTDLFGASAYMNDAAAPWAYTLSKKHPVTVNGSGAFQPVASRREISALAIVPTTCPSSALRSTVTGGVVGVE